MKHLPIARTEIRDIIEGNFYYVDKTKYIVDLMDDAQKYCFLSRPRRFGKSLFVDTLRAAFAGEQELFKGLYIENNWDWSVKHPVITISFGGGTVLDVKELRLSLEYSLKSIALNYSVKLTEEFIPKRFAELIVLLYKKFELPVVVLIDEYDKPLLDNITKPTVEAIRTELSSFYSVLKDASKYLKFVFLTGVSRFSRTSIFSKLNNLTDISLVEKYADICGITQEELEGVFVEHLKGVDLVQLKQWYDGYSFRGSNLYNPYDVLMFLWEKRYKPYWFQTGTPTFLLELMKERRFFLPSLEEVKVFESQLEEFDIENIDLEVLLFQAGYLTIKSERMLGVKYQYTLSVPNLEVKMGLTDYLLRMFYASAISATERTGVSEKIYFAILDNKPDDLKETFYSFFQSIPHEWYRKNNIAQYEGFYSSVFYTFLAALGFSLIPEDKMNKGQMDLSLMTDSSVFIFEFKMKSNPQNALKQIKERKYHEKYLNQGKEIFLIGIEFDEDARNISMFECEKYNTST